MSQRAKDISTNQSRPKEKTVKKYLNKIEVWVTSISKKKNKRLILYKCILIHYSNSIGLYIFIFVYCPVFKSMKPPF